MSPLAVVIADTYIPRRARLRRHFANARVVVFGHTHIPFLEDDLALLNPGSASRATP